ncbi:MAG TPA: TetR/AcrR family transcriptional regulator [Anaerolineales bacterium]
MDDSAGSGSDDKPGRRRGRTHDAEGTRDAILDAGEQVFAEHGFDGARIDSIAKISGYNKSLIFQYFDDKLGLYAAVIRRADDQTRQTQDRALQELIGMKEHLTLEQLKAVLREYVGWYFDYMVEHPRIMRIFNWEMAEGWQTFSKVLSDRDYQDVEQFAPVFARIQDAGLMRRQPMPLLQYTTAMFMIHVYLATVPLYHLLVPQSDSNAPEILAQAREFVIQFIMNGLLVEPGVKKPRRSSSPTMSSPRKKARARR